MSKDRVDPMQYIYPEGVEAKVPGQLITNLIETLEHLILDETKEEVPFKFSYVDVEKGTIVKNAKDADIESGKVVKVPDHQKMMDSELSRSISAKGMDLMRLRYYLASLHHKNIDNGVAVHIEEVLEKQRQASKEEDK